MGIRITNPKSKMPNALKIASHISSFLFEQQYGECKYMRESEIEVLRKANRAIGRAAARSKK